jgi:uncharacterized protein involved in response to NO
MRSLLFDEPQAASALRLAIVGKGFRPFFLLAGAFGAAIIPLWMLVLTGLIQPGDYLPASVWHAHEMVFGFAVAVLAGFLLTAVSNWTKRETLTGVPLLALAALWLLGRVAMLLSGRLPHALTAAVDLSFLPALIVAIARPLVAAGNRRNFVMIGVLAALFAANAVMHASALGLGASDGRRACLVAIDVLVFVILVIAGRVFPMFTRNATGVAEIRSIPALDVATVVGMGIVIVIGIVLPDSSPSAVAAAAVAVLAVARAWHWGTRHVLRHPLLWILHAGYAWLLIGLMLRGVARASTAVPASLSTHALTVGGIGSLTLGMMARVSLGHTGRPMRASPLMTSAFVAVTGAAIARVLCPIVLPGHYFGELLVAGGLWTAAFLTFVVSHAPILCARRVDGKPG